MQLRVTVHTAAAGVRGQFPIIAAIHGPVRPTGVLCPEAVPTAGEILQLSDPEMGHTGLLRHGVPAITGAREAAAVRAVQGIEVQEVLRGLRAEVTGVPVPAVPGLPGEATGVPAAAHPGVHQEV